MNIAIVAPSAVPFVVGGAEKLWWGLLAAINQGTPHNAELIKAPSPERNFAELMQSYRAFSQMRLDHFDLVISTKYPAWMLAHPNHYCYLQHRLRGLYDTYHFTGLPTSLSDQYAHMPLRLRRFVTEMLDAPIERDSLESLFDTIEHLLSQSVLADHFAFPGPLTRALVHRLDAIALAPGAVKRFLAISRNVAQRQDYFPEGAEVTVMHHPSDLEPLRCGEYRHLFTASRLTRSKRIDLIIRAFKQVTTDRQLRIAGTGPMRAELEALAAGDERIRFLGHITDAQLSAEYADALFVPFVPYDEDYGLVTVEAMACAKPILTTVDAGGVNELVDHGRTGLSVAAEPKALANAMRQLLDNINATRGMGERARERVAHIRWPQTVDTLLEPPAPVVGSASGRGRRPRVVIAVDFPVYPPRSGGQARIYNLYKALARRADCTLVTLCDDAQKAGRFNLLPGLTERRIAKSDAHLAASRDLDRQLQASVRDIATLLHAHLTPAYAEAVREETDDCDLLIASHPYLYPVLRALDVPQLWYEAHNVEYDMKRAVLGDTPAAEPYLAAVREAEAALCARAETVLVCATADADRLAGLYAIDAAKCRLVPNGVDTRLVPYVDQQQRASNQRKLGLLRPSLLFMGSWHQPNIEALQHLHQVARALPECDLLVVGSVCGHPVMRDAPANLHSLGQLSDAELEVLLAAVDLALNPVTSGSGTNLKMLHYAAAGVPIISTEFGDRGLMLQNGHDIWLATLANFADQVRCILRLPLQARHARTWQSRLKAERHYDWGVIADALWLPDATSRSEQGG